MAAPDETDSQFALAQALWERDDVRRSEAILRTLAAGEPAREDVSTLLAKLLQSQGRLDAASTVLSDLCRARAFEPELSLRAAQFIQQSHRQALADTLCDLAIAQGGVPPALLAVAGNIARELGDFAKARSRYLDALAAGVDLDTWFVLGALAHTMRYTDAAHTDFGRFAAHFGDETYSARSRAATGFGWAKALDDIGDDATAARTLHSANALVRSVLPWSASAWDAFVDMRLGERVARTATPSGDFRPVFVVGLPRSGTTLAASRLASHTGARDRGELRMLRFIAEQLIGGGHLGDSNALAEAAELYRMHARQDDAPAACYIDQDPMNFRYLHVIEALFPHARVIFCRRGRRDVALSLWAQDFAHRDSAFAYDFESIARFAAGHDRLMRHWQRTLSLPIRTLDYENLVADPAGTLDSLADFIGAPASGGSVAESSAPIHSASVWQARQPIYTASVERWRRYAPFVPELCALFPESSA